MPPYTGRIFFLGAGFSAGADIPLTNTLLPAAARLFNYESSGLFERVCNYAEQVDVDLRGSPNAEDFARLCTHIEFIELREYAGGERWSDKGSREKLALKFFLSKALALSTPELGEIPPQYIDFVRSLNPNDIVVTFNWDLLLELAMDRVGVKYSYNLKENAVQIIKLHGSINWIDGKPKSMGEGRLRFGYEPLGYKDGLMTNEVFSTEALKNVDYWKTAQSLVDEVKPLIVLPGYGKAFDVRTLSLLWYRIEMLNIRSGGISIIGLSVAEDDFIVESLFRYLLRGVVENERLIHILNPDQHVGDRFKDLGKNNNIVFAQDKFSAKTLPFALLN